MLFWMVLVCGGDILIVICKIICGFFDKESGVMFYMYGFDIKIIFVFEFKFDFNSFIVIIVLK